MVLLRLRCATQVSEVCFLPIVDKLIRLSDIDRNNAAATLGWRSVFRYFNCLHLALICETLDLWISQQLLASHVE